MSGTRVDEPVRASRGPGRTVTVEVATLSAVAVSLRPRVRLLTRVLLLMVTPARVTLVTTEIVGAVSPGLRAAA